MKKNEKIDFIFFLLLPYSFFSFLATLLQHYHFSNQQASTKQHSILSLCLSVSVPLSLSFPLQLWTMQHLFFGNCNTFTFFQPWRTFYFIQIWLTFYFILFSIKTIHFFYFFLNIKMMEKRIKHKFEIFTIKIFQTKNKVQPSKLLRTKWMSLKIVFLCLCFWYHGYPHLHMHFKRNP